jgi:hypothetical protein
VTTAARLETLIGVSLWVGCAGGIACQGPEAFRLTPELGVVLDGGQLPIATGGASAGAPGAPPLGIDAATSPPPPSSVTPVSGGVDPCVRRNWTFIPKFLCDTPLCQDVPPSAKNPFNAIDGMPDTRYTTGRPQGSAGPENVVLQLPRLASLTGLTLLTTSGDGPATYLVEYSIDGVRFQGFQPADFGAGSETTAIAFPATTMLAVRVTQTGVKPTNWWSINELDVVGCVPQ